MAAVNHGPTTYFSAPADAFHLFPITRAPLLDTIYLLEWGNWESEIISHIMIYSLQMAATELAKFMIQEFHLSLPWECQRPKESSHRLLLSWCISKDRDKKQNSLGPNQHMTWCRCHKQRFNVLCKNSMPRACQWNSHFPRWAPAFPKDLRQFQSNSRSPPCPFSLLLSLVHVMECTHRANMWLLSCQAQGPQYLSTLQSPHFALLTNASHTMCYETCANIKVMQVSSSCSALHFCVL